MRRLVIVNPPSEFLLDDRVFMSLGPVQIATVARDFAEWRSHVIDLTGHSRRCRLVATAGPAGLEATRGALVGAVSSQPTLAVAHDETCEIEIWANAEAEVAANPADVYGFYAMSCHAAVVTRLHQLVKRCWPRAVTVAGGPHASLAPGDFLRVGFDCVVAAQTGGGGGEVGLLELLRDVTIYGHPRQRVYTSRRGKMSHWNWPDRGLVDWESYEYRLNGERSASIVTQGGCPFVCTFCSHGEGYTDVGRRDHDHVRAELREIRSRFGQRAVMIYDDEVNIDGRRVGGHFDRLCGVLHSEGFLWRAFAKSNIFDARQARLAAASGAVQLCTGAESADPAVKKAILKKSTVEDDSRFVRLCLENGIAPKVFTMVGLQGETRESAGRLKAWLLEMVGLGLRDFDVTVYTPYPGTRPFADPSQFGFRLRRPLEYTRETIIYKGKPGEYRSLVDIYDPATGKTLLTAEEIVALRDEVERDVRAAVARVGGGSGGLRAVDGG